MKRTIYNELIKWKLSKSRKPLIMYGARQVGKTYILKRFGEKEYSNLVYLNCYKNEMMEKLFEQDADAKRILLGLAALSNQTIKESETLVFLDEIQEIPNIISTLKYFCEDLPGIHIVVAGSLLGVMNMKGQSFPVGKVDIMRMLPMSYHEFLVAKGEDGLAGLLQSQDYGMMDVFAEKYTEMLRQYYFVGGMPEAVSHFCQTNDLIGVRQIQKNILTAYETDISKHTGNDTQRIRMVWDSIPSQLAKENKKFIYGAVRKGARAKDFEIAIQWLIDAGLVYKVERTKEARMPLKFYADANVFKLYLLDVGLLGAMTDTSAALMLIENSAFTEYKGAFTENYVLQQLKTINDMPVYYYSKENSTLEIDFIVQTATTVHPVEVKAEENVKAKSLSTFVNNDCKGMNIKGVRLSMKGYADQEWMVNVPLYAAREFFLGT